MNNTTTDLPTRSSPRGRLSVSDHRRSALAGLNSSTGEPALGDAHLPQSDPRSSSRSHASNGGSPVLASTGDPHHHQRTPSLGELHQELEQEQEAQVNRLLQMIRSQQAQLQQLQQSTGTAVIDETSTTPQSELSSSFPPIPPLPPAGNRTSTQLSSSLSGRRSSRTSSQAASPNLRPQSSLHHLRGGPEGLDSIAGTNERNGSRDESAYYQAEASMLARENQMLRQRIRDLERQVSAQAQSTPETAASEAVDKT